MANKTPITPLKYSPVSEHILNEVSTILTQYLDEQGMRHTSERYKILRTIYNIDGLFNVEQLHQKICEHFHVTKATIYASLELFELLGLVVRHNFTKEAITWERTYGVPNHIHQICVRCGRIQEVKSPTLEHTLNVSHWKRFRVNAVSLNAFGICASCQSQIARAHQRIIRIKKKTGQSVNQKSTKKQKTTPKNNL